MKTALCASAASLCALGAAASAQVALRGRSEPLNGTVAAVDLTGVALRVGSGTPNDPAKIIGWDRVRVVEGDMSSAAAPFMGTALSLWRARTRLERGDWALAEPLFEEAAVVYKGVGGPTAAVVDEGLLRCRLERGAVAAAVGPFLSWTSVLSTGRASGSGASGARASEWVGGRVDLPPVRDEATGLVPALPPVWLPDPSLRVAVASGDWDTFTEGAGTVQDLARAYRQAARFEADGSAGPSAGQAARPENAGVRLVTEMVQARTGTPAERQAARLLLEKRIAAILTASGGASAEPADRWIEAWCRAGLGRSLIREEDEVSRRRGVLELLHLPARFASEHPYLAGVALAEASVALRGLGDDASAARLVVELGVRYPGHPALDWEALGAPAAAPDDAGAAPTANDVGSKATAPPLP